MVKIKDVGGSDGARGGFVRIIKGAGFSILLTLLLLLIYSCLLTYTSVNENTMPAVIIIVSALSILAGSILSSLNIKKNGLTSGALVGVIYILFIYLLSSIVSGNFGFSIYSVIMIIASIIAGSVGGIIGVNR